MQHLYVLQTPVQRTCCLQCKMLSMLEKIVSILFEFGFFYWFAVTDITVAIPPLNVCNTLCTCPQSIQQWFVDSFFHMMPVDSNNTLYWVLILVGGPGKTATHDEKIPNSYVFFYVGICDVTLIWGRFEKLNEDFCPHLRKKPSNREPCSQVAIGMHTCMRYCMTVWGMHIVWHTQYIL